MPGYRKTDLDLANKLFSSPVTIQFVKVEEERVNKLIQELKKLKFEVKTYYENDQLLLEETALFIKTCRKVVGNIRSYSTFFRTNNELIKRYFSLTKKQVYAELFKKNVEPIVDLIKVLRKQENNAFIDLLHRLNMEQNFNPEKTYILTKHMTLDQYLKVGEVKFRIMRDKDFVDLGIYGDVVIFLGTPSYFAHKFSEIFYAEYTMFLGYSCFENQLVKRKSFSNLINQNDVINTLYKDVIIEKGFSGLDYRETFITSKEKKTEEVIINQFIKNTGDSIENKVEAKLATISHNNYIFLPIGQKINIIDRESLKISQVKVRELTFGDLLVFRTQNASNLIREVADKILGTNASNYRGKLERWKRKLRFNVERKGIDKVSSILMRRYGLKVAKEQNIKNWISSYSIKPTCLDELLDIFNFDSKEKKEIIHASNEIFSAHISAGHQISQALMNELDKNLESLIDENGFYTFKSNEFEGASFNIEEIKKITKDTYYISENETLKIIKG